MSHDVGPIVAEPRRRRNRGGGKSASRPLDSPSALPGCRGVGYFAGGHVGVGRGRGFSASRGRPREGGKVEFLFGIAIGLFFLASVILPWINLSSIRRLEDRVRNLERKLQTSTAQPAEDSTAPQDAFAAPEAPAWPPPDLAQAPSASREWAGKSSPVPPVRSSGPPKLARDGVAALEQRLGARLAVWIGGVALALAGFFLVKFSIERGLLGPEVRVILGGIFGCCLLAAGHWVRSKADLADGRRIAQALTGAGIADFYVSVFAATTLYGLIPSLLGLIGMAAITAGAVILSLRHGRPIALLGLIGGFLTPALIGSEHPEAATLFIYLYFVTAGLFAVIRKESWWLLGIPAVLAAFLWVLLWLFGGHYAADDSVWLALFLIAVSATVVAASKRRAEAETSAKATPLFGLINLEAGLSYLTLGGALALLGLVTAESGFELTEWGFFAVLSIGGIGLAAFNQRLYGLVPFLSMAVNVVMLAAWSGAGAERFALVLAAFAALFVAAGQMFQFRSLEPRIWAGLSAATALGYYLLGYFRLHDSGLADGIPRFWGILALVLAAGCVFALQTVASKVPDGRPGRQHLFAIYAASATAFISLGLTIELPRDFLPVAFALEVLAVAWINARIEIAALRPLAGVLAGVFGYLLIPQILVLIQLTVFSLIELDLNLQKHLPIVDWPVFQLGAPALFFAAAGHLLRRQKDGYLVQALETASVALIGLMGYYLTRHAFHAGQNVLDITAGFIERGAVTNVLFVFGLGCLWLGRRFGRRAVSACGLALAAICLFRIGYFDLLLANPLWSDQAVGEWPVVNGLLVTYGLPILWIGLAAQRLPGFVPGAAKAYGQAAMMLLTFVLLSLLIRQGFHGSNLAGGETGDVEVYAYSLAWLLLGSALLYLGTLRKSAMIRIASLAVVILTVGKVFLYDASELQDIYRVFSFLGLGLTLLAISWFYTKFVFGQKNGGTAG
jgi:uncharacterized membrane protein